MTIATTMTTTTIMTTVMTVATPIIIITAATTTSTRCQRWRKTNRSLLTFKLPARLELNHLASFLYY